MIGVAVNGAEEVQANLKRAQTEAQAAMVKAMTRGTIIVRQYLTHELSGPERRNVFWGRMGPPGNRLSVRSGITRASLTPGTRVYRHGSTVTGVVGSPQAHLKLHEDGATIHGTSPRGYLRIPTRAAQTRAGVDRWTGMSIKDIPGAFLFLSKAGKLWAAIRKGKRGKLVLLYLLKKSAKLRPRKIFARAALESRPAILRETDGIISVVVRRANA